MKDTILTRTSVRRYTEQPISEQDLHTILRAAMSGPSCVNARDWSFVVIQDKETMAKMADANGRPAEPLRNATAAILVCGDVERAFAGAKDYWIVDCSIAAQNIVLMAKELGIGSVWLGTWPQMERVNKIAELFNLPDSIVPHSIIALGYPAEETTVKQDYEDNRVHFEKW